MPKRSRKVAFAPKGSKPVKSARKARQITSQFHELSRRLEAAHQAGSKAEVVALRRAVEAYRPTYQQASVLATKAFRSTRYFVRVLRVLGALPQPDEPPLRALEIGAVNTQLLSTVGLDVRAIDIRACDARIEEVDFFALPVAPCAYDLVVCAMVLNCVPDAVLRGEMLRRAALSLRPRGLLCGAVPLQCLTRSRFVTEALWLRALRACGLAPLVVKRTPKVFLFVAQRAAAADTAQERRESAGGAPAHAPPHPGLERASAAARAAGEGSVEHGDGAEDVGDWAPRAQRSDAGTGDPAAVEELAGLFPHPAPVKRKGRKLTNQFSIAFSPHADVAVSRLATEAVED